MVQVVKKGAGAKKAGINKAGIKKKAGIKVTKKAGQKVVKTAGGAAGKKGAEVRFLAPSKSIHSFSVFLTCSVSGRSKDGRLGQEICRR